MVDAERGAGDLRRSVLQVWSRDGGLLAEHDRIHGDPVYAACYMRDAWQASVARESIPRPNVQMLGAHQAPAATNPEARQAAQEVA